MRRPAILFLLLLVLTAPALAAARPAAQADRPASTADATAPPDERDARGGDAWVTEDRRRGDEPNCFGKKATIKDHKGVIETTPGNDVIIGDDGPNFVGGVLGVDRICTGGGDDEIGYGSSTDPADRIFVNAGPGKDVIAGTCGGDDVLRGGDGDELSIFGCSGNDRIDGGAGDDGLNGGSGDDRIEGGDGNDNLRDPDGGNDDLFGGPGVDRLQGGPGLDVLSGGKGADTCDPDVDGAGEASFPC